MDLDAPTQRGPAASPMNVEVGMTLTHRSTQTVGTVVRYVQGQQIVIRDASGRDHAFRPQDAAFSRNGTPVALRLLVASPANTDPAFTPSGSVDMGAIPARVARASRLYVVGIHDPALIEKVW
ncbi:MAG: DUF3097 domain-containing protein, partial [Acidimicrobiales bacterium]